MTKASVYCSTPDCCLKAISKILNEFAFFFLKKWINAQSVLTQRSIAFNRDYTRFYAFCLPVLVLVLSDGPQEYTDCFPTSSNQLFQARAEHLKEDLVMHVLFDGGWEGCDYSLPVPS